MRQPESKDSGVERFTGLPPKQIVTLPAHPGVIDPSCVDLEHLRRGIDAEEILHRMAQDLRGPDPGPAGDLDHAATRPEGAERLD